MIHILDLAVTRFFSALCRQTLHESLSIRQSVINNMERTAGLSLFRCLFSYLPTVLYVLYHSYIENVYIAVCGVTWWQKNGSDLMNSPTKWATSMGFHVIQCFWPNIWWKAVCRQKITISHVAWQLCGYQGLMMHYKLFFKNGLQLLEKAQRIP